MNNIQTDTELDNDGDTLENVKKRFINEYPEMTDLEEGILMFVHSKNECSTGIWCESELGDWVNFIQAYVNKAVERELITLAQKRGTNYFEETDYIKDRISELKEKSNHE